MIRAGLRLLEDDENKIRALKKAIWQGIDSARLIILILKSIPDY